MSKSKGGEEKGEERKGQGAEGIVEEVVESGDTGDAWVDIGEVEARAREEGEEAKAEMDAFGAAECVRWLCCGCGGK